MPALYETRESGIKLMFLTPKGQPRDKTDQSRGRWPVCESGLEGQRVMATNKKPGKWRKRTFAVRGGSRRSPFQETSEAIFMTSGYAYENAEEAEARFKGESGGY